MDDPIQLIQKIHHCQLPPDIFIYTHFDEAMQDINKTVVLIDWLIVLMDANVKLSNLTADHLHDVKSWFYDSDSEVWQKCVKDLVLAVPDGDL